MAELKYSVHHTKSHSHDIYIFRSALNSSCRLKPDRLPVVKMFCQAVTRKLDDKDNGNQQS